VLDSLKKIRPLLDFLRVSSASMLLGLWLPSVLAYDTEIPPSAADRQKIRQEGFRESRRELEIGLAQSYNLQKPSLARKNSSFVEWIDLWRWCDLLSRDVSSENAALVQRQFFRRKGSTELVLCLVGVTPPADATPISSDEAARIATAPDVRRAMLEMILPSGSTWEAGSIADIAGKGLAADAVGDPQFLRKLFSTLDTRDFTPLVIKNLRAIREAYPAKWREYADLAIAIAVVNDSALPQYWPHQQVRPDLVPKDVPSVENQFGRWVEANESRRLLLDLRQFSAEQLTFLVDAFLAPSEVAWAQKNITLNAGNFARAFSSIRYREDRIKTRRFFWTEGPYTLAAIQKNGGICIDQAYFAAFAGKALGLPTVLFNGQGSSGGHAWFGYMGRPDKWELHCGRDPNQNLVTGIALDPQTWQPVSDHELRQLAARFRDTPAYLSSMNALTMASIFLKNGDTKNARTALENASQICPQNPEVWKQWGDFLRGSGASVAERLRLHEQAAKALARDSDSKVLHQQAAAALQRDTGNTDQAVAIERRILSQNLGSRSDLSCEAAAARVREALESEGIDQAALVFHAQLRSIGKTNGGNFVKDVGIPFVSALLEKGQKPRALRTVNIMRQQFSPQANSPLDLLLREMAQACK
jgi:tetratricopeptide (TPR) repeat protein